MSKDIYFLQYKIKKVNDILVDVFYADFATALLMDIAKQPRPAGSRKPWEDTGENVRKLILMPGHLSFQHPDIQLEITPIGKAQWRFVIGGNEIDQCPEIKLFKMGWEIYQENH